MREAGGSLFRRWHSPTNRGQYAAEARPYLLSLSSSSHLSLGSSSIKNNEKKRQSSNFRIFKSMYGNRLLLLQGDSNKVFFAAPLQSLLCCPPPVRTTQSSTPEQQPLTPLQSTPHVVNVKNAFYARRRRSQAECEMLIEPGVGARRRTCTTTYYPLLWHIALVAHEKGSDDGPRGIEIIMLL